MSVSLNGSMAGAGNLESKDLMKHSEFVNPTP